MKTYSIELLPFPKDLSPNFRGHTRTKAQAVRSFRQSTFYLLKAAKIPKAPGLVVLDLEYHYTNDPGFYQPKDDDNLIGACKSARDALIDARIVPDDAVQWVQIGKIKFVAGHGGLPKTVMRMHLLDVGEEIPKDDQFFDCNLCGRNYFISRESAARGVCEYCVMELGVAAAKAKTSTTIINMKGQIKNGNEKIGISD